MKLDRERRVIIRTSVVHDENTVCDEQQRLRIDLSDHQRIPWQIAFRMLRSDVAQPVVSAVGMA